MLKAIRRDRKIRVPRFQRGAGVYDHTGGTYSQCGVVDCPRFPISELHLGNFPDSMEFQSWKVNFKPEVCAAFPLDQRSCDSKVNWRSCDIAIDYKAKRDFPDYDMLDAMIAFALKRLLDKHVHF